MPRTCLLSSSRRGLSSRNTEPARKVGEKFSLPLPTRPPLITECDLKLSGDSFDYFRSATSKTVNSRKPAAILKFHNSTTVETPISLHREGHGGHARPLALTGRRSGARGPKQRRGPP